MIFDAHAKVGASFNKTGKSIQLYIEEMKKNNIDKAVLCPNRPLSYSFDEANAYIAQCMKDHPDLFVGAFRVDPWDWDEAKVDRAFTNANYSILYLNPWEDNFQCNSPQVFPICSYAERKGAPILIEAGYPFVSHISQVGDLAEKYPNVNFIVTNAGQIDLSGFSLSDVGYTLKRCKNIYMGTGAAVGAEWLAAQIQDISKGRVLFESGYPAFDVYMEKYRITEAYISAEEKEAVFSINLLKLLK